MDNIESKAELLEHLDRMRADVHKLMRSRHNLAAVDFEIYVALGRFFDAFRNLEEKTQA